MEADKIFWSRDRRNGSGFPNWGRNWPLVHTQSRNGPEAIKAVDPLNHLRFEMLEFQCEWACHSDMQGSTFTLGPARETQWDTLATEVRPDNGAPIREDASLKETALASNRAGRLAAFCADGTQAAGSLVGHAAGCSLMACGCRLPARMLEALGLIDNDSAFTVAHSL
jgi:hypothetical protein